MSTTYTWEDVPVISVSDDESSHAHSQSEPNDSSSQLSFNEISITAPNFDHILKQSLAPIIENLNAIESSVVSINRRLENIDKELETVKSGLETTNKKFRELEHYSGLFENTKNDILKTKTDFENTSELTHQLEKKFENLQIELQQSLEPINESISAVESSVELYNRKIADTDKMLEKINIELEISNKISSEVALKTKTDFENTKREFAVQLAKQVKENVEISMKGMCQQSLAQMSDKISAVERGVELNNRKLANTEKTLEKTNADLDISKKMLSDEDLKNKTDLQNIKSDFKNQLMTNDEKFVKLFSDYKKSVENKLSSNDSKPSIIRHSFVVLMAITILISFGAYVMKVSDNKVNNLSAQMETQNKMLNKTKIEITIRQGIVDSKIKNMDLKETNTVKDLRETDAIITRKLENTKSELQREIIKRSTEATPPGTIAYFTTKYAPIGWLKANGQSVLRTTYASLYARISTTFGSGDGSTTFTLPDLRGEFIRGWSDGRDVDKGRAFASFQWGSSIPYVTYIDNKSEVSSSTGSLQHRAFAGKTFDGGFQYGIKPNQTLNGMTFDGWNKQLNTWFISANTLGRITEWSVLQGTRPRNIALLACIKY